METHQVGIWRESAATLRLALPLMIGQLSQMLLGLADTWMIGRVGVDELAALTFVTSLFHLPLVFGIGVLTAVSVTTSNMRGAGNSDGARQSCRDGHAMGLAIGSLIFILAWPLSFHLDIFAQPDGVLAHAPDFLLVLMFSLIPALASIALKNHADALNRPWPAFWISLGGVALNVLLNWVMIFGKLGFPALGFMGAAWATLIARTAIWFGILLWLSNCRGLTEWVPSRWIRGICRRNAGRMLSLGLPASAQMVFEVGAFSFAAVLTGWIGTNAMAAHQIAVTLAATAFMIPLGLSMALTVRFGEAYGAEKFGQLRTIANSGWMLSLAYSLLAAIFFWLMRDWLAAAFTRNPEL
ncbi:MAG: MATE family efflux transporter, partial [Luteolibacter sp.]